MYISQLANGVLSDSVWRVIAAILLCDAFIAITCSADSMVACTLETVAFKWIFDLSLVPRALLDTE